MRTPFDTELPNLTCNTYREGLIFRGQPRPYSNGAGSQRYSVWGFPSTYAYTLSRRTTKFDVAIHIKRGLVFRQSSTAPSQGGGAPELPNFCGSPLSMTTLFKEEQ